MKFRFTAEDFPEPHEKDRELVLTAINGYTGQEIVLISQEYAARLANALLESEEKKCERVWGYIDDDFGMMVYMDDEDGPHKATHTALLWNVEKIEGEK